VHETILKSVLSAGGRIAHSRIGIDHYSDTKSPQRTARKKEQYLRLCERNIAERPMDVKALLEAGTQLRDLGEYGRAVEVFERALKLNPHFVWAVAGLIETALTGLCSYRAARRAVERFEQTRPIDMPEVQINYAMLLAEFGETREARRRLDAALDAAPHNAVGHHILGLLSEREDDTAAADRAYGRALELVAEYPACRGRRAAMHVRLRAAGLLEDGDTLGAVRALRTAIDGDPGNELALNDLAVILYRESRPQEAAKLLRRAVDRHPWMDVLRANFLDVMAALGRADEAERIVREAQEKMEDGGGG